MFIRPEREVKWVAEMERMNLGLVSIWVARMAQQGEGPRMGRGGAGGDVREPGESSGKPVQGESAMPKVKEARKENHNVAQHGPRAAGNHGNSSLQGMAETNPK